MKKEIRNILAALLFSVIALMSPIANAVLIDFENFQGMDFLGGSVSTESQLSNQFESTFGVVFSSLGGADFVGVVDLETGSPSAHAPSGTNGIGGVSDTGFLNYSAPIKVSFYDPILSSTQAVTDFISITGDLRPIAGDIILKAFDINDGLLAIDQQTDSPGGRVVSIAVPNIHYFTVESTSGTVAFDDLIFNEVSTISVPEPETIWLLFLGFFAVLGFNKKYI